MKRINEDGLNLVTPAANPSNDGIERRIQPRFPLPVGRVSGKLSRATLLNISRQGMAVEVPVSASFARGESHSFTLQDLSHSVEVKGRVCWVRSDWRHHGGGNRVEYIQVAGFTFEEILTESPAGIWRNLRTVPTEKGEHEGFIGPELPDTELLSG